MSPFPTQCGAKLCKSLSLTQLWVTNRHRFHERIDFGSWHKNLSKTKVQANVLYLRRIPNCSIPAIWDGFDCVHLAYPKHPLHLARDFTIAGVCRILHIWEVRGNVQQLLWLAIYKPAFTQKLWHFSVLERKFLNMRLPSTMYIIVYFIYIYL